MACIHFRQRKRIPIARSQQFPLPMAAALPNRSDCVDDILGQEPIPRRDERFSRGDIANLPSCGQEFWPRHPMDSPIHPTAHNRPRIRRIDNDIDLHFRDVIADDD